MGVVENVAAHECVVFNAGQQHLFERDGRGLDSMAPHAGGIERDSARQRRTPQVP